MPPRRTTVFRLATPEEALLHALSKLNRVLDEAEARLSAPRPPESATPPPERRVYAAPND